MVSKKLHRRGLRVRTYGKASTDLSDPVTLSDDRPARLAFRADRPPPYLSTISVSYIADLKSEPSMLGLM